MECITKVEAALVREGFATCVLEDKPARAFLQQLGSIIEETQVRQHKGAKTYLAGREPVPLHTDHPAADLVAWYCEAQDQRDRASILVDGYVIVRAMGKMAEDLRGVELYVPPQLPRQTANRVQAWDGNRLYYAPWYPVVKADDAGRQAFRIFSNLLAIGFGHRRVRLKPGELLVVDNGRWLHGRDMLPKGSNRFLQRYWLHQKSSRDYADSD